MGLHGLPLTSLLNSSSSSPHLHRHSLLPLPLSPSPFTPTRHLKISSARSSGGTTLRVSALAERSPVCKASSSGGETEAKSLADADAILLSVGGMVCGGCSASVKRILESQPQVVAATVDLEKETAVIQVVPEVKVTQNWKPQLGEMLANHLTTCGFKSNLQGDN